MVSSKMAASVLKRCMSVAVKVKRSPFFLTGRRWLLSTAYKDTTLWESREKDPQNLALLANLMDRTYERNFPVSSLTMSRFVDNISSREEVDQAEYYLYKFRHSPNCWYLREWTIHGWIRQCLTHGARDKALHTVKNKVQYGIFPDEFTFNLLIDSFIEDGDYKSACSVVEEVMLQEAFNSSSTQILSLFALGNYLATRPQLTVSEEHTLGASLLLCGMKHENTLGLSAELLGNAFLGKVEHLKGIHGVFKGMPLSWIRGYLERMLAVMERVTAASSDAKLCKDVLEYVSHLLQELTSFSESDSSEEESGGEEEKITNIVDEKTQAIDEEDLAEKEKLPQYISRFEELRALLESRGKVDSTSFQALVTTLAHEKLGGAEKPDLEEYHSHIQAWETERKQLAQREKEFREKAEQEKSERLAAQAAAQQA
ncbi:small ribosomal subunit protein mS27 isoform X2 [Gouania willdenowi]|uniref:small ribosomal subunit protein mS27 isoform X2 n=1 Tax=Gouania willdenowi TaxID=441366 RepID=UPI0010555534|nr:28S ribosomal protein S27, mitochondrial isoform X2 [Gouania willdenowi]